MKNNTTQNQLSRRNFLRSAASGTALLALAPATNLFAVNVPAEFA